MTEYYRGNIKDHATFWVSLRDLPVEARFTAFINFYKKVEQEVREGKCSIRDAGYALLPGRRERGIEGAGKTDVLFACMIASDLANWFYDYKDEAESDWHQIVEIMHKYVENE